MPFDAAGDDVIDDPVLRLLVRGRNRVALGWTKGAYHDGDKYCMVGALSYCFSDDVAYYAAKLLYRSLPLAYRFACFAMILRYPSYFQRRMFHARLTRYNDLFCARTKDVLAVFDKAIAKRRRITGEIR